MSSKVLCRSTKSAITLHFPRLRAYTRPPVTAGSSTQSSHRSTFSNQIDFESISSHHAFTYPDVDLCIGLLQNALNQLINAIHAFRHKCHEHCAQLSCEHFLRL